MHVGTLNHYHWRGDDRWNAYGVWPRELPEAHRYWAVFRCDEHAAPPSTAVAPLAAELTDLRRGQEFEGIQLDIDVPTGSLRQYAAFLHELRAHLAPGTKISITALLDWFRDGTSIGEVVKEVDEFVPQFYACIDIAIRACPPGLQGTLMMMVAATFALSMRGGDVLGSWIYGLSPKYGFQYCVIAITVTYALILPVIPFIPKQLTATADGEPNAEVEALVFEEIGDAGDPT